MYNKKIIFAGACLGMLFFGIGLITLGSVVPGLKMKYGLDDISAGTLFSILPFGILIGSLVFGPFCDRYGYKLLLFLSCIFLFAGFEGIAYAPSATALSLCILVFGMGAGAINGATNALVSDISEKERRGASLSLLGVFFGLGALGMPFVLGILQKRYSYETIVSVVGFLILAVSFFYLFMRFPAAKQTTGSSIVKNFYIIKDPLLLLIAFFLFCQSSFEAIINNWTTTFLRYRIGMEVDKSLFALSLFVAGMTVMRLLLGSMLKNVSVSKLWTGCFVLILAGLLLLSFATSFWVSAAALVLTGMGLAAGFPLMLGFVGSQYEKLSGTAFSLVLVIALTGNMIINYVMGAVVQAYGIRHLITVALLEWVVMVALCAAILKKLKTNK
jgi:MFS family permease